MPFKKEKTVDAVKEKIKAKLSADRTVNMAALAKLLKEMMNYDEKG